MKFINPGRYLITTRLVKESIDNIPIGLVYAVDNRLVLVNRFMNEISNMLLEKDIVNHDEFWNEIRKSNLTTNNIAVLPDKRAILFTREDSEQDEKNVTEIMAYDVTDLYNIRLEKKRQNKELLDTNKRLRRYSENAVEITKKRELLERKRNIHDEFGRLLLVSRNLIEKEDAVESEFDELLSKWGEMLEVFSYSGVLPATGKGGPALNQLKEAAKTLGIDIIMYGHAVRDDDIDNILLAAGGECLTNLARHAKGKTLYIGIMDNGFEYIIEFMNDGKVPERAVREGGGLKGLRKRLEDMGAIMSVAGKPRFRLTINVPKRGDMNV